MNAIGEQERQRIESDARDLWERWCARKFRSECALMSRGSSLDVWPAGWTDEQRDEARRTGAVRAVVDRAGTDPIRSEEDIRCAMCVDGEHERLAELLPYVIDACRSRGILLYPDEDPNP